MGVSPLHASTVGLILNPTTNRLSPQVHCIYDEHFETVHSIRNKIQNIWEDLVINSRFRNLVEETESFRETWLDEIETREIPHEEEVLKEKEQQNP